MTAAPADPAPPDPGPPDSESLAPSGRLTEDAALELLNRGDFALEGRLVDASNTTLRAFLTLDGVTARCVYKPVRGERPLWDFPDGTLAGRETAAYLVSKAAGWDVVPPTVLRDGPLGIGACQLWIEEPGDGSDLVGFISVRRLPSEWFQIMSARDEAGRPYALAHADDPRLAAMATFDAVVNNADRKGGHIILGEADRVYGVDHGVCFHTDDKLRTVLWGWAGEPLPDEARDTLRRLAGLLDHDLGGQLSAHLTSREVGAVGARIGRLLESGRYPLPPADWPAVPWPPI